MVSSVEFRALAAEPVSIPVEAPVYAWESDSGLKITNELLAEDFEGLKDCEGFFSSLSVHHGFRESRTLRIKRATDLMIALFLLLTFFPLLLLIALVIKLESRGPTIFVQQRLGLGGMPFGIFKFRTMRVLENGTNVVQCDRNDKRVTRFGSFLRRTSLDELPQLLNVAIGQMSLVGPRPHPVSLDLRFAQQVPGYYQRFQVRPGMTGLSQVRGYRGPIRNELELRGRICSDLEYVESHSLLLDFKILVETIPAVILGWRQK
jgi:undecaprenyl-phosphate glucose phosphotransferase